MHLHRTRNINMPTAYLIEKIVGFVFFLMIRLFHFYITPFKSKSKLFQNEVSREIEVFA